MSSSSSELGRFVDAASGVIEDQFIFFSNIFYSPSQYLLKLSVIANEEMNEYTIPRPSVDARVVEMAL